MLFSEIRQPKHEASNNYISRMHQPCIRARARKTQFRNNFYCTFLNNYLLHPLPLLVFACFLLIFVPHESQVLPMHKIRVSQTRLLSRTILINKLMPRGPSEYHQAIHPGYSHTKEEIPGRNPAPQDNPYEVSSPPAGLSPWQYGIPYCRHHPLPCI